MTRIERIVTAIAFAIPPEEVDEDMVAYLRACPDLSLFRERFAPVREEQN
jgi:hypothetical protein